jgi:two-component system response regulator YesN
MEESRMYKVLLVDDEPTIREGLRTLIAWDELGFEVIDTAANGYEALQKCEQLRPDLLIADIRLPGMSGLELIKTLRMNDNRMHVLILSGYADFEYAKQAIIHRIDGYLLKPVDEDELSSYLVKLRDDLDRETVTLQERVEEREAGFERIVQSLLAAESNLQSSLSAHKEGPEWDSYEIILIKPVILNERDSAKFGLIKLKLSEVFDEYGKGIVFAMEPYIGIVLKDGLGDDRKSQSTGKDIADTCAEFVSDFVAVSGGEVSHWLDIAVSYHQALERMKDRFFLDNGIISRKDRNSAIQQTADNARELDHLLSAATDTLFLTLEIGNQLIARKIIHETAEEMIRNGSTEDEIKTRFVQMFSTVLDKLIHDRSEGHRLELRAGMLEIYKETRYLGLVERLAAIAEGMANAQDNSGTDMQIKRMIDLIHRNYRENLKLDKLSEIFNYNSAYLGKLFKQATGEHFNTYLDKVRIEQSKLLLEQGLKVYQVAEKVGYANVDYFHTKFRKYVGTSPSSYRKA